MNEESANDLSKMVNKLNVNSANFDSISNNNNNNKASNDCKINEDAITTDSDEYLSEPLRYRSFQYSTSSNNSNITLTPHYANGMEENGNCITDLSFTNIEVPIVGYEVMEERARFTVFKLRIENKSTGDCWFVFRRYTDFARLCNKLKRTHPQVVQYLPRGRWLGNNFDPLFLEERVNGLQTLVNAILSESELINLQQIQDFFCLNEPPVISDANHESRAMFDAFEDTIYQLQRQLKEKDAMIDTLQDSLHSKVIENDNLKKIIRNTTANCEKCQKDYENMSYLYQIKSGAENSNSKTPLSSTVSDLSIVE